MNRRGLLITIVIITIIILVMVYALNYTTNYEKIRISNAEWKEITSIRRQEKFIRLESIKFNDYNLIIDDEQSKIYYSVVNDRSKKSDPSISYTTNDKSCKLVVQDTPIDESKIYNNHLLNISVLIYNDSSYRIYDLVCIDSPIVSVNHNENDRSKNRDSNILVFDNLKPNSNRVIVSQGVLRQIDNGYSLMFTMMSLGNNERDNDVSLFNMRPANNYILQRVDIMVNGQNDNQAQKVMLFINNRYQGYYYLSPQNGLQKAKNNM